jgi:hypothetical protein
LARNTRLLVDGRPPAILFFDETDFAPSTHAKR